MSDIREKNTSDAARRARVLAAIEGFQAAKKGKKAVKGAIYPLSKNCKLLRLKNLRKWQGTVLPLALP